MINIMRTVKIISSVIILGSPTGNEISLIMVQIEGEREAEDAV